ncbi:MAG: flavoprotein [bacterium]
MKQKNLKGKCVILGVTGSIAAYKSCLVITGLKKHGADVIAVMTENSKKFITSFTLQNLSQNKVVEGLFDLNYTPTVEHISLADRADAVLVVPATANVIGKLACGIADDMLTCICLATNAPKIVCPAMNVNMYKNAIVQENIAKLKGRGYHFVEPTIGRLASGIKGKGRLADIDTIIKEVLRIL